MGIHGGDPIRSPVRNADGKIDARRLYMDYINVRLEEARMLRIVWALIGGIVAVAVIIVIVWAVIQPSRR